MHFPTGYYQLITITSTAFIVQTNKQMTDANFSIVCEVYFPCHL